MTDTAPAAIELPVSRVLTHRGQRPALKAASVRIAGNLISAVAPADERARIETTIIPALVDAHDHGRGLRSLAYGVGDQPLELWLPLLGREPRVDPYLRAAVAFADLARSGVGAVNHCHNPQHLPSIVEEAKAVARASRDVGIRVAFAVPMRDRNYIALGDPAPIAEALGAVDFKALTDRIHRPTTDEQLDWIDRIAAFEHPLFHVQYGPVAPQWCSDALLERIAEASASNGRRIHMHLFETQRQREWADAHYPGGLIRALDSIGLLSDRFETVAHGVWLRPDECELLAARGVTVSVNTSSNLRLSSGIAPVAAFKAAGLHWAMGLDGMAFDDDADALRELRLLWRHQQGTGFAAPITVADLCDAVFVNGRRTITPVAGGSVEPGLAADLALLDHAKMTADMMDADADELGVILTRGRKEYVRGLIVAGRTIIEQGTVRSIDLPAAENELWAQARSGWAGSHAADDLRRRHRDALMKFYACGCHRMVPPA